MMGKHPPFLPDPRLTAAKDLLQWLRDGQLTYRQRSDFDSEVDSGFYRNLVGNVIRHYRKYRFLVEKLSARAADQLDPEVMICLMLGLVQLEETSRVKVHAAVNETVQLIAHLSRPHLKGFVNANLRSYTRKRETLLKQLAAQPFAVQTSHSDWMVDRWNRQFGEIQTQAICKANNHLPSISIILNPAFNSASLIDDLRNSGYELIANEAGGFIVSDPAGLFDTVWSRRGAFLVQDTSSHYINHLIAPLSKRRVLDACAAPGGKLFHLEWEQGTKIEELVAIDKSENRFHRLRENGRRYQSKALMLLMDATQLGFKDHFDLILVDAPCSSTGTIQKHPEIKWHRQEVDFERNQMNQLAILNGIKDQVKSGGHVLYITCSLENEENQAVIHRFLQDNPARFRMVPFTTDTITNQFLNAEGFFRCLPSYNRMGLFAGLLQKR